MNLPSACSLKGFCEATGWSLTSPFDFSCPRPRYLQNLGSAHRPLFSISQLLIKFLTPCCDYNFLYYTEVATLRTWVVFLLPQNDGKIELGDGAQETVPMRASGTGEGVGTPGAGGGGAGLCTSL